MTITRSPWLSLLPLLLATAGCVEPDPTEGPNGEAVDTASEAIVETAEDKIAFDFFLAKGLSPVQSAGIIGNLDQESGMDPTVFQYGGGPGRGIAQWSAGGRWDTTPNANVVWLANQLGQDKFSLNLQLEFIWWEFTHVGYGYSDLKKATTIVQAVTIFQNQYEICGQCEQANRIAHAQAALDQFGDDVVAPYFSATFVSQSWPYASDGPIQMTQYQAQTGSIDLKNTGNAVWKAGVVKLAPIPRDEPSPFAGVTWISPTRVSTLDADVAPGAVGHFEWDLEPQEAGDFQPYFGLVADGVTWFADSGGPGDDVMQVSIHVEPGEPPMTTTSGGDGGDSGDGGDDGDGNGGAPSTNNGVGGGSDGVEEESDGSGDLEGFTKCWVDAAGSSRSVGGVAWGAIAVAGVALMRRRRRSV